jgi:hypothetical protein
MTASPARGDAHRVVVRPTGAEQGVMPLQTSVNGSARQRAVVTRAILPVPDLLGQLHKPRDALKIAEHAFQRGGIAALTEMAINDRTTFALALIHVLAHEDN